MNIKNMNPLELSVLFDALGTAVYNNPQLSNLVALRDELEERIKSNVTYQKGEELLALAEEHGIDDGYADGSDYYFAIHEGKMRNSNEKNVRLLLCFKFKWYMDGESFNPADGGGRARNFSDFLPDGIEMDDYGDDGDEMFNPEDITQDPDVVRGWLTAAGYEEKPELIPFYEAYLAAQNTKYGR